MRSRAVAAWAAGALVGLAIAWFDARPGNDATGITAVGLVVTSAAVASIAGHRPWLSALVVGLWVPLVEVPASGDPAALVALVFAAAGAAFGHLVGRAIVAGRVAKAG